MTQTVRLSAERGRVPDATVNARQRTADKFQCHEGVGRKPRLECARRLGGEAKPRVITRIAEDEDGALAAAFQRFQAEFNEAGPDSLAVKIGMDRERRESGSRVRIAVCLDEHSAEEQLADDALLNYSDERRDHRTLAIERVNQICLGRPSKRRLDDGSNGRGVVGLLPPDFPRCRHQDHYRRRENTQAAHFASL
jgi:hypothetical protein